MPITDFMSKMANSELEFSDLTFDAIHKQVHENNMQLINIVEVPRLVLQVITVLSPFDSIRTLHTQKLLSSMKARR